MSAGPSLALSAERRQSLAGLVVAWARQRQADRSFRTLGHPAADPWVEVSRAEVLRSGRPGLLSVEATIDGRPGHALLGILRPGHEPRPLHGDEAALGLFEDDDGLGVAVDALGDAELVTLVLESVLAEAGRSLPLGPGSPLVRADGEIVTTVDFTDRCTLSVFCWPPPGPHPGVELLVALDQAGFNHLAAPLARWRRQDRDLGVVQELHPSRVDAWALALTSLRDLYGGTAEQPERAGGDFGQEARALGVMVARMHLALDRSFGRHRSEAARWAEAVEEQVGRCDHALLEEEEVTAILARAAALGPVAALRTHGDLHLGRIVRTDQGWVLSDFCSPPPPVAASPEDWRSPLFDVASLLWSLHHLASVAAAERDQVARPDLRSPAEAWAARNRRALVSGYLSVPGIGGLVPASTEAVRSLLALFELEWATLRRSVPAARTGRLR